MMSPCADIPFHAAGTPGVANGKVAGLDDRVFCQQIPVVDFVVNEISANNTNIKVIAVPIILLDLLIWLGFNSFF